MNEKKKEYYIYLAKTTFRVLLYMAVLVTAFIFIKNTYGDEWETWIDPLREKPMMMFLIFLISEMIIGILPPEFFIIWALNDNVWHYIGNVSILAIISLAGALTNFLIGNLILKVRFFRKIFIRILRKYTPIYQKWGGVVIIIAAISHLPFAAVSLVSATMRFPFWKYLLFASTRLIRFAVYAWILWYVNMM